MCLHVCACCMDVCAMCVCSCVCTCCVCMPCVHVSFSPGRGIVQLCCFHKWNPEATRGRRRESSSPQGRGVRSQGAPRHQAQRRLQLPKARLLNWKSEMVTKARHRRESGQRRHKIPLEERRAQNRRERTSGQGHSAPGRLRASAVSRCGAAPAPSAPGSAPPSSHPPNPNLAADTPVSPGFSRFRR